MIGADNDVGNLILKTVRESVLRKKITLSNYFKCQVMLWRVLMMVQFISYWMCIKNDLNTIMY